MKKIILSAFVALLSMSTMVANNMNNTFAQTTESVRKVNKFTKIAISGDVEVYYTQGNTHSVKVVGDKQYVAKTQVSSDGNTLSISAKKSGLRAFTKLSDDDIKVYVTSPDLIGIYASGSSKFKATRKIDSDNLLISLRGDAEVELANVICDNIHVDVKGSGEVKLEHLRCANAKYTLSGSGEIETNQYNVKNTIIDVMGSGEVTADMTNCGNVKCNVIGSGEANLRGNVVSLTQSVKGSGEINTFHLTTKK